MVQHGHAVAESTIQQWTKSRGRLEKEHVVEWDRCDAVSTDQTAERSVGIDHGVCRSGGDRERGGGVVQGPRERMHRL
jgi:hypothetical protein